MSRFTGQEVPIARLARDGRTNPGQTELPTFGVCDRGPAGLLAAARGYDDIEAPVDGP